MIRETLTCEHCGAKGQIEARDQASFDGLVAKWEAKHEAHAPQPVQEPVEDEVTEEKPPAIKDEAPKSTRRSKATSDD